MDTDYPAYRIGGKVERHKYYNIFSNDFAIPFSSIILSSMILSEKIEGRACYQPGGHRHAATERESKTKPSGAGGGRGDKIMDSKIIFWRL
jgi:hypothetical protein